MWKLPCVNVCKLLIPLQALLAWVAETHSGLDRISHLTVHTQWSLLPAQPAPQTARPTTNPTTHLLPAQFIHHLFSLMLCAIPSLSCLTLPQSGQRSSSILSTSCPVQICIHLPNSQATFLLSRTFSLTIFILFSFLFLQFFVFLFGGWSLILSHSGVQPWTVQDLSDLSLPTVFSGEKVLRRISHHNESSAAAPLGPGRPSLLLHTCK